MLDSNWIKKDTKEKMSIVADKYFEKTDANYKNLSPEEKTVLKQKQFASISQDLKGEKEYSTRICNESSWVIRSIKWQENVNWRI